MVSLVKMTNLERLKSVMEQSKSYKIKEIVDLLNQKYTEEQVASCVITLSYIMDGFMDESGEISENRPIIFGSNHEFMYIDRKKLEENGEDIKTSDSVNLSQNSINSISISSNSIQNSSISIKSNTSINPFSQNLPTKFVRKYSSSPMYNSLLEKMDIEDLLKKLLYGNEEYFGHDKSSLDIKALSELLKYYHLSEGKIDKCIKFISNIMSIASFPLTASLNYEVHTVDTTTRIVKFITEFGAYYYFIDILNRHLIVNNFNAHLQKYFVQKSSAHLFESHEDLMIRGKRVTNIGLLAMARARIDYYTKIDDIAHSLEKLVCDGHRIEECLFDLGEKYVNVDCIDFKVTEMDKKTKSLYYGNHISDKARLKNIRDIINEFLYENMVVLTGVEGSHNISCAYPSRSIGIIYNTEHKIRFFCIFRSSKLDFYQKVKSKVRHLDNLYEDVYVLCDNGTINPFSNFHSLLYDGNYKFLPLKDVYKQLVGKPVNIVTLSYLKQMISDYNVESFLETKGQKIFRKKL